MLPQWAQILLILLQESRSARSSAHIQLLKHQVEPLRQKLPGKRVILSPEDPERPLRAVPF